MPSPTNQKEKAKLEILETMPVYELYGQREKQIYWNGMLLLQPHLHLTLSMKSKANVKLKKDERHYSHQNH